MEIKNKILYIDFFNYFYQSFEVVKSVDENGEPNGGFVGVISALQRLVKKFTPQKVVIVMDGPDAGLRRKSLLSTYKDKRGRRSRSASIEIDDEHTEYVANDQTQLRDLYNFFKQLPVQVLIIPFYEADDIIAHLAQKSPEYYHIICSADKDYLQLVSSNISVWSPQKKILFTPEVLQQYYDIVPTNFIYLRSIVGDSSDKLSGVKGIGEDTLVKLLPEIKTNPFSDFWDFWNQIEKLEEGTGKQIKKLKEGKAQAHLMFQLMQLGTSTLSQKALENLQQQLDEQNQKTFSRTTLKLYCIKERLEFYIKDFDVWVKPFIFLKSNIPLNVT